MSLIGKRIAMAREAAGMNQSELARALNVKPQAVQKWESGGAPRHSRIQEIAEKLNVTAAYLLTDGADHAKAHDYGSGLNVPLLANAASMGVGEELAEYDVVRGALTLAPRFVSDHIHPTKPEALRFIHAYGDSMEPTLSSGDILLVDTGVQEVKIDGIYVLSAHGRLFVKRARQRMDGKFEISSDNPTVKTSDVLNGEDEVRVVGRVLWYWNGHRVM